MTPVTPDSPQPMELDAVFNEPVSVNALETVEHFVADVVDELAGLQTGMLRRTDPTFGILNEIYITWHLSWFLAQTDLEAETVLSEDAVLRLDGRMMWSYVC